ncbi:hypothetical protein [Flavobacterium anhuiense]|uniref:hypothetical protein n=1 Tax=Flavobacterium anhuiense TaxID=459526 RepID=UPI002027215F|nr:hypothetical protein [Flavobacterium anhuiense]URM37170.1 hypothetical protein LLY39_00835 [Flavobacterium anhuiense]
MSSETKVIIIGSAPTGAEAAAISKILSKTAGVTLVECAQAFENASLQMQEISKLHSSSIKDFSIAANQLKVSMRIQENSQPKSKYINNPRHNFKTRGIPQKRNNKNYYKK